MTTTDRTGRRRELGKLTKPQLIRICTRGVRTPDGSTRATEGGMYPLSAWRKDEIVDWIISAEYGPLPSEAGRDAHLTGEVAKQLMAKASDLFAKPPEISRVDVLADKLPG